MLQELKQSLLKEIEVKYIPLKRNRLFALCSIPERFKKMYNCFAFPQDAILQVEGNKARQQDFFPLSAKST